MRKGGIAYLAFTERGRALAERLRGALGGAAACTRDGARLREWTAEQFASARALVYIGAAGIAVRAIAPHLTDKASDPAVVCEDERGRFAIPLASGHLGGANELARRIAGVLGATAVVTTATDVNGIFAIDAWAARQGLAIENPQKIKWISGRLLAGETIRLRSELPIAGTPPRGVELVEQDGYDVLISCRTRGSREALRLVPRCLAVGMGTRKGVSAETVREGYEAALKKGSLNPLAVESVCTLDLKKEEPGLLALCRDLGVELRTFTAAELAAAPGSFTASEFVKNVTGVDNVCERSAVLGSGGGRLLLKKNAGNGVTAAVAAREMKLRF
jgi:cobalt-precorrin 5A hydrolase